MNLVKAFTKAAPALFVIGLSNDITSLAGPGLMASH